MKIDTAINHKRRFNVRIADLFGSFCCYHPTHKEICKTLKEQVYNTVLWKRIPEWLRCYVRGCIDTRLELLYQYELEWKLPFNGVLYSKWDELPEEGKKHYMQADTSGNHFWRNSEDKF